MSAAAALPLRDNWCRFHTASVSGAEADAYAEQEQRAPIALSHR